MDNIIKRPILAIIFFVIIILFGIYSYKDMPIELVPDPEQGLPELVVSYNWGGASPETILRKVLLPVEEEIAQIKGVEKITSRADQASGDVTVEFSRNTRMNFANVQLAERLNRLQRDLPREVIGPRITERIPRDFRQRPLFYIGIYGKNYSIYTLRKIAEKEVLPHLKAIPGIKSADIYGGVEPEIKIKTDIDRMEKFGVSINDIVTRLNQNFYTRQSLSFTKSQGEITLSLSKSPKNMEEVQNIVIRREGEEKIYLKNVADVFLGYQELSVERRFQGQSFIQFELYKESSYSHLDVANRVRDKLAYIANRMGGRIEFMIQSDESQTLKRQLVKLGKIAFLILVIIFFILLIIVRDVKSSLLIFSSVFFSVFATFTVIYLFKIPLNMLTLSGLALGFGLFVDNAVVVFDSILRFRERGYERAKAAAEGAKAVILPVLASTFTTIIVFFSFALLFEDRLRIYYLPLAYIITASLLSSIVVSFVLIPSLSARINLKTKNGKNNINNIKEDTAADVTGGVTEAAIEDTTGDKTEDISEDLIEDTGLEKKTGKKSADKELFTKGKFFPAVLKYPLLIIIPICIALLWSYNVFKEEVSFGRFFAWFSQERIIVRLMFRSGTEFKEIQKSITSFEKIAREKPYEKEVNTIIYPRGAYMSIKFPPHIEATALPVQLKQELVGMATNLAGVGVHVAGFDQEPYYYNPETGTHLPYSIKISGYNFEKLMDFAKEFKRNLLNHKRIKDADIQTDMRFWFGAKDKYYTFKVNREKLKIYDMRPSYLYGIIGAVVRESSGSERIKYDDRELLVQIKASDVEDLELDDILNKQFTVPGSGKPFRMQDVVDIELNTQKGGISREDQEYQAMVQWDYLGSAKAGDRYHKTVYKNLVVPPGFKKSLEERTYRLSAEEQRQIWDAILLSAVLIYLLLAMLYENFFQPVLIMAAIPLALIGVFMAFVIAEYSFDSTGWIGIILLGGIVVNNSILLIDNINRHLKVNPKIVEAIAIGTKERIRPIFMTTLTTVLGMLPMILVKEGAASQADLWSTLALCTVGGLTTSALLILFVLPICYYLLYKFQKFITTVTWKSFWTAAPKLAGVKVGSPKSETESQST